MAHGYSSGKRCGTDSKIGNRSLVPSSDNVFPHLTQNCTPYAKYAFITQMLLRKIYAIITQIKLRIYYANISILRKYITQILRRYYADITQTNYAFITHFTQNYANKLRIYYANKLRNITQNNYANHYAFYAVITQIHYANMITQFPKILLRRLRKYHFHYASLRNGQLADALPASHPLAS